MTNIQVGERVAIMRGFQAVGGPGIAQFGTVVKITNPWDDTDASQFSYMVTGDDGETGYLLGYMLRPFASDGTLCFQPHDYNYGDDVTDPADPPAGEDLAHDADPECECVACVDDGSYENSPEPYDRPRDEYDNPCQFAGGGGYCEGQDGHDGPHDINLDRGIRRGYAWHD